MSRIRIGTRGSKLALWQAEWVADHLRSGGHEIELVIISTHGDTAREPLHQVGGQGLFTKEIQRELLACRIDVAVHSLKDLPTEKIAGLLLAAVPQRESTDDVLISRTKQPFEELPSGARVGTGSLRRAAQLRTWRSDVKIVDIRGNVDSRIRKVLDGQYDAIVLAAAGITRLELHEHVTERLPQSRMLPAVGQGALGIECRSDDERTQVALAALNHVPSFACVTAERSLLSHLLAGCMAPVAALGTVQADGLSLRGRVISTNGMTVIEDVHVGQPEDAVQIGKELAKKLFSQGAQEIIEASRNLD